MRLLNLLVKNFIGLEELNIDFENVVLVHGGNAVGKTSLVHAITLAIMGTHERVKLKRDLPKMIREGSEEAFVGVQLEHKGTVQDLAVNLRQSGEHTGLRSGYDLEMDYVLHPHKFGADTIDKRKALLFILSGIRYTAEELAGQLIENGAPRGLAEELVQFMGAGFEAVAKEAEIRQSESRGKWAQITGEKRYGSKKAVGWEQKTVSLASSPEALKEKLEALRDERSKLQGRVDAFRDSQQKRRELSFRQERLDEQMRAAQGVEEQIDKTDKAIASAQTKINDLIGQLADAEKVMACPNCGSALVVAGDELTDYENDAPLDTDELDKELKSERAHLGMLNERRATLLKTQREGDAAAKALDAMAGADDAMALTDDELRELTARLEELRDDIPKAEQDYDEARRATEINRNAAEVTAAARKEHERVEGFGVIKDLCSPEGLPSKLLERVVGPMNDRLIACSMLTKWPRVTITGDMEIYFGSRPYPLLSESEQWRCDAQIAEAVSTLAGYNLLLLDRVDILEVKERGALMQWCMALAGEGKQCLLLATLKNKFEAEGVQSIWLETE